MERQPLCPASDPEWPGGPGPAPEELETLGAGAGGRLWQRWRRPGPWGASLFVKNLGTGRRARRRARREFGAARRLRERGAPAPRPWAVLETAAGVLLALEDLGPGAALGREELLADPALLEAAGAALGRLHRAGAVHGDCHRGNLLRGPDGPVFADLARLRFPWRPDEYGMWRDLGHLLASLEPVPPRPLLVLVRAWLGALQGGALPDLRRTGEAARQALLLAESRFRAHHRNLDRRAARRVRHGRHPAVFREPELVALQAWFETAAEQGEVLKDSPSSRVIRVHRDGRSWILKHYRRRRPLDPRDALGRSKALRSLLAAEALRRRGLPAARPLAAWSAPGRGSFLLLEDLPRHRPLHEAVLQVSGEERRRLLEEVACLVARLHRSGVAYRDLKPSNLLVDLQAPAGERLRLLDHDRNRFRRPPVRLRQRARDLAALHAGLPPEVRAAERLRALRRYDPGLGMQPGWSLVVPSILEEAAARRHRWVPRRLLAGAGEAGR